MVQLSSVPRQQTMLRVAKAKSFSFGLWFRTRDQDRQFGSPVLPLPADYQGIDITDDTVRLVVYKKPRWGSTVVVNMLATLVEPEHGYCRVDLQGEDTDLDVGVYDFSITWVAENYSGVVVQGELEVVANGEVDSLDDPDYTIDPPLHMGVVVNETNMVKVVIDHLRAPDLDIGSVTTVSAGDPAGAYFTGAYPHQLLHLTIPRGFGGDPPTLEIGDVEVGASPFDAEVELVPDGPGAYLMNFTLPRANAAALGGKVFLDAYPEISGNGVVDDQFYIQQVLDSLIPFGGGTVELGSDKTYLIDAADLQVPDGVWIDGLGWNTSGFKLGAGRKIRVGVWGDGDRPAGLTRLFVDGDGVSAADGAVHFQSVQANLLFCKVTGGAGHNILLDAAQNAEIIGCYSTLAGDAALAIKNGAGGYNFLGSHFTTSQKCLKIFDEDSVTGNAYPFGSAHINFFGGIFEQYANGVGVADIRCGSLVKFWGVGFSVNGAVTMSGGYVVRIGNEDFPAISTYIDFIGCNFNGGDTKYDLVRIEGNQFVSFNGENYIQQSLKPVHITAGSPRVRQFGDFVQGANITQPIFQASGAGSVVSVYNEHTVGENYKMPDDRTTVLSTSRRTDAGHRFFLDRDGKLNWNEGADFGISQSLQFDSATDLLTHSSAYVAGRFGLYPGAFVFANGAVTIDCKTRSVWRYVLTGAGQISAMTVNNPVDGAVLTIQVFDVTSIHTLTWPASFQFADNRKPEQAINTWLSVTMIYDATNSVWLEIARVEGMPASAGDGSGATPRRSVLKADATAAYSLVLSDRGKWITLSNAGAIVLTVPTNAAVAFPIGTEIDFSAMGAGQVTITPAGGVTVNSRGGRLKTNGQYSVFSLKKTAADTWLAYGDLTT